MAGVRIFMVNLTFILMHPETHISHPERANLINIHSSLIPTYPESTFTASKMSLYKDLVLLRIMMHPERLLIAQSRVLDRFYMRSQWIYIE